MRLTAENKEKIRRKIVASAAKAFRRRGIDKVTLDDLMKGAGLTRGAFYAHFKSKGALVAAVLRTEHPLLRMLLARKATTAADLWAEMATIFTNYLEPANLEKVYVGCTLASLTGEAARANKMHKQAFEAALIDIAREMDRGIASNSTLLLTAVVRASGAVNTAMACDSLEIRDNILRDAQADVLRMLRAAAPDVAS